VSNGQHDDEWFDIMPRDTIFLLRDADEMWSDTIVGSPLDMSDTLIMVTPAFIRKIENDIQILKEQVRVLQEQYQPKIGIKQRQKPEL
jgi:hypothetical protein